MRGLKPCEDCTVTEELVLPVAWLVLEQQHHARRGRAQRPWGSLSLDVVRESSREVAG